MADKILMNKNTLAALKVELKEYEEALPIFEMKENQLTALVRVLEEDIERLNQSIEATNRSIQPWVSVLSEQEINIADFVEVETVNTEVKEVVGVTVEIFESITFKEIDIDLLTTPLWIDAAEEVIKDQITTQTTITYKRKEIALLEEELAEARRMKNALKEVFIPENIDNIRKIEIYLGDVERLAIGCAKLVKKKKLDKQAV